MRVRFSDLDIDAAPLWRILENRGDFWRLLENLGDRQGGTRREAWPSLSDVGSSWRLRWARSPFGVDGGVGGSPTEQPLQGKGVVSTPSKAEDL